MLKGLLTPIASRQSLEEVLSPQITNDPDADG
jgi:hypothetical protein